MQMTRTSSIRLIKIGLVSLGCLSILGYAAWRSLDYTRGPSIDIHEPVHGASTASSTVVIWGQVHRLNKLLLNGDPITMDEQGSFSETRIVFPGINSYSLVGEDQFGRKTSATVTVLGTVELPGSETYAQ